MCAVRRFATEMEIPPPLSPFFLSLRLACFILLKSIRHGVVMQRSDDEAANVHAIFSVSVDSQRVERRPNWTKSLRRIYSEMNAQLFTPDSWKGIDLNGDR